MKTNGILNPHNRIIPSIMLGTVWPDAWKALCALPKTPKKAILIPNIMSNLPPSSMTAGSSMNILNIGSLKMKKMIEHANKSSAVTPIVL